MSADDPIRDAAMLADGGRGIEGLVLKRASKRLLAARAPASQTSVEAL